MASLILVGLLARSPMGAVADTCVLEMPEAVQNANDLLFTAVFVDHPQDAADSTEHDWVFRVGHLLAGETLNDKLRPDLRLSPGKLSTAYGRCAPLQHIAIGREYLVSTDNIGSLSSMETVIWEVLPGDSVHLVHEYNSVGLDAAFLAPQTIPDVVALVTGLPPTDGAGASGNGRGWPLQLFAAATGAIVGWRALRRRNGSARL